MPKTSKNPIQNYEENILSLRKCFLEDFQNVQNKEEYDLEYVNKIKEDDGLLERYLWHHHGDINKSLEHLKEIAKYRQENGIKELKLSSLNQEIIKTSALYPNKNDHNGDPIVLLAVNRITRNSDQNSDKQQIILYLAEKIITTAPNNMVTFMLDCEGVGVSHMDLEMMVFITKTLLRNYPGSLGYVLVYDMPFLFNVIWQVIKALLPKQYKSKVKFIDKNSVQEYIKPDCLPKRMGGQVPDYYDFDTDEYKDKL